MTIPGRYLCPGTEQFLPPWGFDIKYDNLGENSTSGAPFKLTYRGFYKVSSSFNIGDDSQRYTQNLPNPASGTGQTYSMSGNNRDLAWGGSPGPTLAVNATKISWDASQNQVVAAFPGGSDKQDNGYPC